MYNVQRNNVVLLRLFPVEGCMCGSRGETGGLDPPPHLKNHKNIEFLSNSNLDPPKITKLPSQHLMLGHQRHASERHLNGVSLAGR